jgi:glycosyltransferase involved in cell wall biosynthesis
LPQSRHAALAARAPEVYDGAVRVALFCPSFGQVGGIETKAGILVDAFRTHGHAVTVLARGEPATSRGPGDVPVVRLAYHQLPRRGRHLARQLRFARTLPGAVRALRRAVLDADVVLSLAISSYAPYAIALASAAPVVMSLEGGGPGFTRNPRVMRWALRRASRVVAVASSLARAAASLAPDVQSRLSVIPNGVDPARFASGPVFSHPRRYVLAVARLSHEKGIDVLLEAFAAFGPGAGELDLVVAGDGPERARLVAQCTALGLDHRVHFLGDVAPERLPALYRGAAVVACPSRWEGLPLVCLEAMASGRAVVASAVDGTPDAVVDGETGVLVPPEHPGALARAIETLLRTPGRAERLGARGADIVRERFDWRRVGERYMDVLRDAAG